MTIDSSFATVDALEPGHYVCKVSDATGVTVVKKALPEVLAIYGRSFAMATQAAGAGGAAVLQTDGLVPPAIHGLTGGPSLVRIGADAKGEKVSAYQPGDFPGGNLDDHDQLAIHPERSVSSAASVTAGAGLELDGGALGLSDQALAVVDPAGALSAPSSWLLTTQPPAAPGATGSYVELTFSYPSSIDAGLPDMPGKYCYDAGLGALGDLPVIVLFHSYSGGLNEVTSTIMRRWASYGFLACTFEMRGRVDGAPDGSADSAGREPYDILDGLAHVRALLPAVASQTVASGYGWSGGGGIAYSLASKAPDTFVSFTAVSGISDYGYDTTAGWWYQTQSHRAQLETEAGDREADPNAYRSRNAVEAIPRQLAAGGYLYMFHDSEDGDVPVGHARRVLAAMQAERLLNVTLNETGPGDPLRWIHGFVYVETEWPVVRRALGAEPWSVPVRGRARVIGWLKTKRFEIWLGGTDDPKTTAGGGIGHVADVEYDTLSRVYRVTPLTGSMHVQIVQTDDNGTTEVQAVVATPTDVELNSIPDTISAITDIPGCIADYDAGVGITLAGSDVASWADQSPAAQDPFASATNRPAAGTIGGLPAVSFDAASSERLDGTALFDADADWTLLFFVRSTSPDGVPFSQANSGAQTKDLFMFRHQATSAIARLVDDASVGTEAGNSNSTPGNWEIITLRRTANRLRVQVEGFSESEIDLPVGAVVQDISCLGALFHQAGHGSFATFDLREFIAFGRSISDRELFQLREFLALKWAGSAYVPAQLGALTLAVDARPANVTVDGSTNVSAMANLAGGALTLAQATPGSRPHYLANAGDGLPALDFVPADTTALNGSGGVPCANAAADYTMVALVAPDADGVIFAVSGTGTRVAHIDASPTLARSRIFDDAAGDTEIGKAMSAGWRVVVGRRQGSTLKIRVDALSEVTGALPANNTTLTTFTLGLWPGFSHFDGKLAALYCYSEHLSDAAIDQLRTYLGTIFPGRVA